MEGTRHLHFDLGNFASTQDHVAEMTTRFIWEEMAQMSIAATTPGSRDLSHWDLYTEFLAAGEIPIVSSNLLLRHSDGTTRPLGERYRILDVDGVKVGVIGLIGGNEFVNSKIPIEVKIDFVDPATAARELVPEVRNQAEIVILLSQMPVADTDRLLEKIPGIDVALYGYRSSFVEKAEMVQNTITNKSGIRGQFLGELVLILDPDGNVVDWGSKNGPLDRLWPDNPDVLVRVEEFEAGAATRKAEAREEAKLVTETKNSPDKYLGAETCRRCHAQAYDHWMSTPHAAAFSSLHEDHGMEMNGECASCHVTGWREPNGYVEGSTQPDLRNVQCEACHGPGTEHVRTDGASKMAEAVCTTCHTGEFAKEFDFANYYELVRHTPNDSGE